MEKRLIAFFLLSALLVGVNFALQAIFLPKPQPVAQNEKEEAGKQDEKDKKADKKTAKPAAKEPDKAKPAEPDAPAIAAAKPVAKANPPQWFSLGSANDESPYRMLVTLTNRGAAIERLELNGPHYRDIDDRTANEGYLGFLSPADAPRNRGALVQVVGHGTPADEATIKVGDVITAIGDQTVDSADALEAALRTTSPGETVDVLIDRKGKKSTVEVRLARRPLSVIHPEFQSKPLDVVAVDHDPFSCLFTLQQVGDEKVEKDAEELAGLNLRTAAWDVDDEKTSIEKVVFFQDLPEQKLRVEKHYRLAKKNPEDLEQPAYDLILEVQIHNLSEQAQEISYRLDGPTGLPIEGWWYSNKIGRTSGAGLRDVVLRFANNQPEQITCTQIVDESYKEKGEAPPLRYIAVDAQYFAVAYLPQTKEPSDVWLERIAPLQVGAVPKDGRPKTLTDVSFRLTSKKFELAPEGDPKATLTHAYQVFAGPKAPALLAQYGTPQANLDDLAYYGWPIFAVVARLMLSILHFFNAIVHNYGIAIILLTVMVRGCMFPLSRKQAQSAQKMQELQPEIKRLNEKYKKAPDQKMQAQRELFRKHNYNPMGGCLPMFIQLPIFIGLYRSLSIDIELRQAPLFGSAIRWCSNLAAPDMFWDWSAYMPTFITQGVGFFGLGPYLNVLPLVTVGLFLWQQKMFMPPPADEQAAMQQKMMQYMMIVMALMFYKVPSGLCLYFIASSLWGIAERKLLPKSLPAGSTEVAKVAADSSANGSSGGKKKRQRNRG